MQALMLLRSSKLLRRYMFPGASSWLCWSLMNIILEKREELYAEQKINSCKPEEMKPCNCVTFAYLINLAVSMLAISLLCQVRAARNYASLYVNNVQMFVEVTIKGQFENKSAWILQKFLIAKEGETWSQKNGRKQATAQNKATKKGFLHQWYMHHGICIIGMILFKLFWNKDKGRTCMHRIYLFFSCMKSREMKLSW